MHLLALVVALALQDTASRRSPPPDSYANPATADLVTRARAARTRNERLVTSYTAVVSQRIGVGVRAMSRDRMLFRQEVSAKISWKRDAKSTIEVTGARQAIPIAFRGDHTPEDLQSEVRDLVVNPAEDYLRIVGVNEDGFSYPIRDGGESDYRFAAGDTTTISLPSGKKIRLLELKVIPRRSDWRLMSGTLWFDADTYGLVRAVFKPARPFELQRDLAKEDKEDVPKWVNATGEVKFVTLEYGLYEDRWWMLRYAAIEAVGGMGSWLGMPIRFERTYDDYEVEGGTPPPPGSTFRPAGSNRPESKDSLSPADSVARKIRRDSIRAAHRTCEREADKIADTTKGGWRQKAAAVRKAERLCYRDEEANDSSLAVVVPEDTLALLHSPTLGAPILQMGDLISESELKGLADAIRRIPGAPTGSQLVLPRGLYSVLEKARFNRVEGLSLGIGGRFDRGRLSLDALGRIGLADGVPNGELGVTLINPNARFRLGGYRRLAAVNPDVKPFGLINSVWGFLGQRDDGDYYRTLGVELTGQNSNSGWWSWRLFAEQERLARVETNFGLPHLFDGDHRFRPNVQADRADLFGASITFRGSRALSHTFLLGGDATFDAAGGDYDFGRGAVAGRVIVTPAGPWALAVEAAAGTSVGTLPIQQNFYLGGPATLRGYTGAVTAGAAFWRGRVEVGNSFPAARITLFSDIGWAGRKEDFGTGKPLLSAGIGGSVIDGLIRMDVSRALRAPRGWRFDLYFDGRL